MRKVCVNKGLIDDSIKKTIQGYVVFADVSSVKAALELNNSIIPMESKDDTETNNTLWMRVDTAKPTIDTARSVFVGNLPYSAQEGLLQEHFLTQLGDESVEGVRIVRDRETMQCKGFGYVLLKTKALVAEALTKLPESIFMKRKLRIKACGKRFKGTGKRLAAVEGSSSKDTTPNQTSEGRRTTPITGAGRRILRKIEKEGAPPQNGRKRRRAEKKNTPTKHAISKKAAATVKANKKVKKLQKRISKGMGKTKH
jgi:RNA recognition motif-containing protein